MCLHHKGCSLQKYFQPHTFVQAVLRILGEMSAFYLKKREKK